MDRDYPNMNDSTMIIKNATPNAKPKHITNLPRSFINLHSPMLIPHGGLRYCTSSSSKLFPYILTSSTLPPRGSVFSSGIQNSGATRASLRSSICLVSFPVVRDLDFALAALAAELPPNPNFALYAETACVRIAYCDASWFRSSWAGITCGGCLSTGAWQSIGFLLGEREHGVIHVATREECQRSSGNKFTASEPQRG